MLASGMPKNPSLTTTAHEERTERSGMVGRSQRVPSTVATPSGEVKACLADVNEVTEPSDLQRLYKPRA